MNKIAISIIALLMLGGCAHHHTRHAGKDRHYVVVQVDVTDSEKYDQFLALEVPILKEHAAYIAMDIRSKDQKKRHIIVSFPNRKAVDDFVKSAEFQEILPLNKASSTSTVFHGYLHP